MYTIEDIGINDAWYGHRDSLIGAIVTLNKITHCHENGYVEADVDVSDSELNRMGFDCSNLHFYKVILKPVQQITFAV